MPYTTSGPIVATSDYQVIQNLVVTSKSGSAISDGGHTGVLVLNNIVHHKNGPGVLVTGSGTAVISTDIINDGAPLSGPNTTPVENNIECSGAANLNVTNVRLTGGSNGIYLQGCRGAHLAGIEGHDQRGPSPRGQMIQFNQSDDGSLDNFSAENSLTLSNTGDNISVYQTARVTITNGLVDGNTQPASSGVTADQGSTDITVRGVDAVHQSNGCFSSYAPGTLRIVFDHVRCRDMILTTINGSPGSKGLAFAAYPGQPAGSVVITHATYWNLANPTNVLFDATVVSPFSATLAFFVPRPALRVALCQYGY